MVRLEASETPSPEAPPQGPARPPEVPAAEVALLRERLGVLLGAGWEEKERAHHTDAQGQVAAVCLPIRAALRLLGDMSPHPSDQTIN